MRRNYKFSSSALSQLPRCFYYKLTHPFLSILNNVENVRELQGKRKYIESIYGIEFWKVAEYAFYGIPGPPILDIINGIEFSKRHFLMRSLEAIKIAAQESR